MITSKQQIIGKDDLCAETVFVPEWEDSVRVRVMTGRELEKFDFANYLDKKKNDFNYMVRLCAATICGENNELLFTESDIVELGKKNGSALDRISRVAKKINGLDRDAIEQIAKNSESAQEESFLSNSD